MYSIFSETKNNLNALKEHVVGKMQEENNYNYGYIQYSISQDVFLWIIGRIMLRVWKGKMENEE